MVPSMTSTATTIDYFAGDDDKTIITVIPCGAGKADTPCAARGLYTGSSFRLALAAAEANGDTVLILSALHGVVTPDTVLAPYDLKMGDPGSITVEMLADQLADIGLADLTFADAEIFAYLPAAYFARFDAACRILGHYPADVYEAAPGIGYQRGVCARVAA